MRRSVRSVALVVGGLVVLGALGACGSDGGDAIVASGGAADPSTTTETSADAAPDLPEGLATAQLLPAGEELVALGPADPEDESSREVVLFRSPDAVSWAGPEPISGFDVTGDEIFSAGTGDEDGLVLVGATFVGASSAGPGGRTPLAMTSSDGQDWQPVDATVLAPAVGLTSVTVDRDGSGFLAAGETRDRVPVLLASDDGREWEPVETSGLEVADGSENVLALGATSGAVVAFGLTECDECSDDAVVVGWVSTDGAEWEEVGLGPLGDALDQPNTDEIPLVVGTPEELVAIVGASSTEGPPTLWVSDDGTTWAEGPPLDVPADAQFRSAAPLGDEVILSFAVDGVPVVQRVDPSA